jgi:hypothetical protein
MILDRVTKDIADELRRSGFDDARAWQTVMGCITFLIGLVFGLGLVLSLAAAGGIAYVAGLVGTATPACTANPRNFRGTRRFFRIGGVPGLRSRGPRRIIRAEVTGDLGLGTSDPQRGPWPRWRPARPAAATAPQPSAGVDPCAKTIPWTQSGAASETALLEPDGDPASTGLMPPLCAETWAP